MWDWLTGPKVIVAFGIATMVMNRRDIVSAAHTLGVVTGRAVGTLRKGRAQLQRVISDSDVDVVSLNQELQESLAEVRAIRGELHSMSNFSARALASRDAFDPKESDLAKADMRGNMAKAGVPSSALEQYEAIAQPKFAGPQTVSGGGDSASPVASSVSDASDADAGFDHSVPRDSIAGFAAAMAATPVGEAPRAARPPPQPAAATATAAPKRRPAAPAARRKPASAHSNPSLALVSSAREDINYAARGEAGEGGAHLIAESIVERAMLDFAEGQGADTSAAATEEGTGRQ